MHINILTSDISNTNLSLKTTNLRITATHLKLRSLTHTNMSSTMTHSRNTIINITKILSIKMTQIIKTLSITQCYMTTIKSLIILKVFTLSPWYLRLHPVLSKNRTQSLWSNRFIIMAIVIIIQRQRQTPLISSNNILHWFKSINRTMYLLHVIYLNTLITRKILYIIIQPLSPTPKPDDQK